MNVPPELRHLPNQEIKRLLRARPPFDDRAASASAVLRQLKLGFNHEPYQWVNVGIVQKQPTRHWTKPTWWERVKVADGKWGATAHYGKPFIPKAKAEAQP